MRKRRGRKFRPEFLTFEDRVVPTTVAVIDQGIDPGAFAPGVILAGFDATRYYDGTHGDTSPREGVYSYHGTAVASVILAHAPAGTTILPIFVGAGPVVNMEDVARGISIAWRNGTTIINVSLGSTAFDGTLVASLEVAGFHGNALIVAAAGDYGVDLRRTPVYPAASNYLQNVVSIGAADATWNLLPTSDRGLIDYAAPGQNIPVILPGGAHATLTGTSFSAAVVSGVAAGIAAANPGTSPIAIRQALHRVFPVPADSTSLAYANKPVSFFTTPPFRRPMVRPGFAFSFARLRRLPIHRPPANPVIHSLVYRPPPTPVPPGGGRP